VSFLSYKSGRTTYTVCGRCFAYYPGTFEHSCDRDWTRFLRDCKCSNCRNFWSWHDTHKSVREESGH
jgi:hypothetical protein